MRFRSQRRVTFDEQCPRCVTWMPAHSIACTGCGRLLTTTIQLPIPRQRPQRAAAA